MKKSAALFVLISTAVSLLTAQEKLEPIFPVENRELIYLEAENAVSTNFSKEPTLNYGASGSRSLQLNRNVGLHGNSPFYVEFAFLASEDAEYEIWYGGTPAGPEDDLLPSYSSPFQIRIDNGPADSIYRENINVVENYSPSYYWNKLKKPLNLKTGNHTIRLEVAEKRRYDGKYFFYLDSLFLIKKGSSEKPVDRTAKFPSDRENRIIDTPFASVAEYEAAIKANPDNIKQYVYLSLVYSLIGDYQNALRVLKRAYSHDPKNSEVLLLLAKNRIWRGDFAEGINAYQEYLKTYPDNLAIWKEAGKVAAWIGKYAESQAIYTEAISKFQDLSLIVNLGLTYLWQADNVRAEELFNEARKTSETDIRLLKELADVYRVNGYPERALPVYRRGIELFPQEIEFPLLLAQTFSVLGKTDDSAKVYTEIENRFLPTDKLTSYLNLAREQAELKDKVIEGYRKEISENPDNLELRETLVETYFWNGKKDEAIKEYYNILANHAFRQIQDYDRQNQDLIVFTDMITVFSNYFREIPGKAAKLKTEGNSALSRYENAAAEARKFEEKVKAAQGTSLAVPESGDPKAVLSQAETSLAEYVEQAEAFLARLELNLAGFAEENSRLDSFIENQKEAKEKFDRLAQPLSWTWDKKFYTDELSGNAKNEPSIAGHTLARIFQIDGSFAQAEKLYRAADETGRSRSATQYSLWETLLWSGKAEDRKVVLQALSPQVKEYAPFIDRIEKADTEIRTETPRGAVFTGKTVERAREVFTALDTARTNAAAKFSEAERTLDAGFSLLRQQLESNFFDLQEKTLLLRFELGDYLLAAKKLPEASLQLRHVLAIDPANLNALYKLGTVRQLYGDWYEAMDFYRRVYSIDPGFQNAAGYHNLISRRHPNPLNFDAKIFSDTSRVVTTAEASYKHALSSTAAVKTVFRTESLRMYKDNAWAGNEASTHQLTSLFASLPLDFYAKGLTVTPFAGFDLGSGIYDNPGGYTDSKTPDPLWYFGDYLITPNFGLESSIRLGSVSVSGGYSFARERDTFIPGRPEVYRHTGDLSLSLPIVIGNHFGLSMINLRTAGSASLLTDGNIKGTAVQDGGFYFHVLDAPWTTLGLVTSVIFEHSKERPDPEIYYAPNGVFVAKAGPLGSTYITLKNKKVIGLVGQILSGVYIEKITETAEPKFYIEGLMRMEMSLDASTFFIGLYGSGSYEKQFPADYWSFQINLGFTQKVSGLLSQ